MKYVLTIIRHGMYNVPIDYLFIRTATFYSKGDIVILKYSTVEEVMDLGDKI